MSIRGILARLRRVWQFAERFAAGEIDDGRRWSPETKAALRLLEVSFANRAQAGVVDLSQAGIRVFSQFEEDGLLVAVFGALGAANRLFVDIGSADGITSNCANLAVNFGWHGLFIDGATDQVERGRRWYATHPDTFLFPPVFVDAMVTRDNINGLIRGAGFSGEVDFLSIDIDGNDYWIWEALEAINPRVVMVESNAAFGDRPVVVPYDPTFVYSDEYFGAGPEAFRRLASRKGYRLVGANRFGFNLIFVRNGIGETALPEVSLESVRGHVRNPIIARAFDGIAQRPFVSVPVAGPTPR
jgi:hypothetical protein